jgi:plastocyanin
MTRSLGRIVGRPRAVIATLIVFALALLTIFGSATSTAAADVAVTINGFAFMPATMTVPVGTRVVWTNQQAQVPHTVTSDTAGVFDSGTLQTGMTFAFTFNQVGTFAYHCNIHPNMHGTVVVTAAGTTATVAPAVPAAPPVAPPPAAVAPAPAPSVTLPVAPPRTGGGGEAGTYFIHRLGDG